MRLIGQVAKIGAEQLTDDSTIGFKELEEIDLLKESLLAEQGMNNVYDLASADLEEIVVSVGINPRLLIRASDRALLLGARNRDDGEAGPGPDQYRIRTGPLPPGPEALGREFDREPGGHPPRCESDDRDPGKDRPQRLVHAAGSPEVRPEREICPGGQEPTRMYLDPREIPLKPNK